MAEMKFKVNVESEGADEAREKIEGLTRAIQMLPPQVIVQNCEGCEINIHPSQNVWTDTGEIEEESK